MSETLVVLCILALGLSVFAGYPLPGEEFHGRPNKRVFVRCEENATFTTTIDDEKTTISCNDFPGISQISALSIHCESCCVAWGKTSF